MKSEKSPFIAGVGAVTGYGWGRDALWRGLHSGVSAVVPTPGYEDVLGHTVWIASVAEGGSPADGAGRFSRALRATAREAVNDALARGWVPGRKVGLVHAVVLGDVLQWRDFYLVDGRERSVRGYLSLMPSTAISLLMQEFGFHGPAMNVSAMCASGNSAFLTAKAWIDAGVATDVVVVATDISGTPENVKHFRDLGVAVTDVPPDQACRPFQPGSRGFVLGEASVAFVLTGDVRGNDARPYARLRGGAMNHDAFHVTSINPDLDHVRAVLDDALTDAGVKGRDVRYLNAHGPGTKQCDAAESALLADSLTDAEVYSLKPLAGHCQAAAAAVEIAGAVLGYEHAVIPAPRHAVEGGHERLLDGATAQRDGVTVKTSLGMGGHNSAIILDSVT
ncbi:MAG: 3-oxoacyl-[acyl-carrier-protein] synthase [Frankiaceae bacterium]|nr:3-oxoacyl-[acyl-carrier-protein] synthase [Frankiaceae bacterium]